LLPFWWWLHRAKRQRRTDKTGRMAQDKDSPYHCWHSIVFDIHWTGDNLLFQSATDYRKNPPEMIHPEKRIEALC